MRQRLLAVTAFTLLATALGWAPAAKPPAPWFPPTVVRNVSLRASSLLPARADGLSLSPSGVLSAEAATPSHRDTRGSAAGSSSGPASTRTVEACSGIWSTMVGLSWNQTGPGEVKVSISSGDGGSAPFGKATVVRSDPAEGPDPGSPDAAQQVTGGIDPLWTGGSRCARVTLGVSAGTSISSVDATFLNTSGTAGGPDSQLQPPTDSSGLAVQAANASVPQPPIVSRAGWGGPAKPRCGPWYAPRLQMAFVHHTDGSNSYTKAQAPAIVRGIWYFHTYVRHWCDIAYSFLIDKYGTIFEGRVGGMLLPVIDAATMGFNYGSTNIALMGNYVTGYPTGPEIAALKRLLAWRLDVGHVPPVGQAVMISGGGWGNPWPRGAHVRLPDITGHRNANWTACPGTHVEVLLGSIRDAVEGMGLPKIYLPTATSSKPRTPPWTITARGSTTLDWTVTITDPSNTVIRTFTMSGTRFHAVWDGTDDGGVSEPPGPYTVDIAARAGGRSALPATIALRIAPPPSPSPSPSPTPSPSPS